MIREDIARMEALQAQQESKIRRAFWAFLETARSPSTTNQFRHLLDQGNFQGAAKIINTHVNALSTIIPAVFVATAQSEVEYHAPYVGGVVHKARLPAPKIGIGFDPSNERAAGVMRAARLQFVQEFTDGQRAATRAALADAFSRGSGTRVAAQAFRDSIGLTETQQAAVANYRLLLESGSKDALARDLRDRRYDPTVARTFDNGEPLAQSQIDRMVDRYRDNMLDYRAEGIARTEALRTTSQAQAEALTQIMEQAGIADDQVRRTWRSTRDKRTRDTHREMNGQQVIGTNTPFVSPSGAELLYPGDPSAPAAEVIRCRCRVTIEILTQAEVEAA